MSNVHIILTFDFLEKYWICGNFCKNSFIENTNMINKSHLHFYGQNNCF